MSKLILFRDPQTSVTGSRQALSGPWIAIMWFPMAHLCMTSLLPRGILHHWAQGIEKRRCVPCREQIWSNWTVTYNEEMAIFKILLGTINLILVTKYQYTAFLTFLGANPKAFPQSLFFISLQILMLVSIPNFRSSWDDRPCQFSCIWATTFTSMISSIYPPPSNHGWALRSRLRFYVRTSLHRELLLTWVFNCHLFSEESQMPTVCPQNNSDFQWSIKCFQVQGPPTQCPILSSYDIICPSTGGFSYPSLDAQAILSCPHSFIPHTMVTIPTSFSLLGAVHSWFYSPSPPQFVSVQTTKQVIWLAKIWTPPPQHWTIGTRVYLETKLFQSKNQKSLSKFNMENWLQSRQKSKKNYQEKVRQSSHLWHQ